MTDNTTCDLSLNVAVSTAVTLCETNDMATCSKGKVIVIVIITSKKSVILSLLLLFSESNQ